VSYDDRYGYPGRFAITKCLVCDHKSLNTKFTPEEITNLYSNYYPRSACSVETYQPHREVRGFKAWLSGEYSHAFRWVPKNVRVLDVGCGFGETLGYHKKRGCDVYGVEADENIRRVADAFNYDVHVGLFDPNIYAKESFDYVTLDQVIEHVVDPMEIFQGIAQVLKPGGTAIIGTPNSNGWGARLFGRRWISWHIPYHLQFFSRHSMERAARQNGMELRTVRTVTSSEWLYYQWIHLFTCPEMGTPSTYWSHKRQKSRRDKIIIALITAFHRTRIDHLVTRFFDMLGIGDNYLFFLVKM